MGLMVGVMCVISNTDMLVKLRDRKLLVGKCGSNMIRLLPPLNISDQDLSRGISIIADTLQEFQDD